MSEKEEPPIITQLKELSDEEMYEVARIIDQGLRRYRLRHGQPAAPERPEHRACRRQS